ncbi:MAG: aldo/keto reductase, partial [Planctomycetota bacterium]
PSYGESEVKLGKALEGARDRVVLATKTLQRRRAPAIEELDRSLRRLKTDRVDLWQFHSLASNRDVDQIVGEDGALQAGREAVKAGKVRFLGVTGHADPRVFVEALRRHAFDALLIPLNCIDPHHLSFQTIALPFARERGAGVVAMKVYCSGRLPSRSIVEADDCLRYTYGLPISTCTVGCSTVPQVELAARVARDPRPLSDGARAALLERTRRHSPDLEWYKARR